MSFQLRGYQTSAIEATLRSWGEYDKVLGVSPTGSGKTVIAAILAERRRSTGPTLFLAHREELIDQAIAKMSSITDLRIGKEKAEHQASLDDDVVVASVQTLTREARLARWPSDHFGSLIVDEAHHILAETYQRILGRFDGHAKVLGITATPDRGDKRMLGEYVADIAFEISLRDLIEQQHLSRITCRTVPIEIDLSAVKQKAGDYDENDLGDALLPYLGQIAAAIKEFAGERKTLVFLPLIATSKAFVEEARRVGLLAEHVDGTSVDRKEILRRFSTGETMLLSNAMLLTEGYDEPTVDCVVVLRPTRSRALYSQMVGRGTRTSPGKENLLLLDFLWMVERHSLVKPASLFAPSDEIASRVTAELNGNEGDLMDVFDRVRQQREADLARQLAAQAKRQAKVIDPLQWAVDLGDKALQEFEPTMRWHSDAVTEKQKRVLEQRGFDVEAIKTKGQASLILAKLFERQTNNLATPKQVRWLTIKGHPSPTTATFEEAKAFLDIAFRR